VRKVREGSVQSAHSETKASLEPHYAWDGTYITITFFDKTPSGKTGIWWVWSDYHSERGFVLGEIKWFSHWRKYAFFPYADTLYEQTCLREIAQFIDERMAER
jgi:hypothetical protein